MTKAPSDEMLSAWLDGELSEADSAMVEASVNADPSLLDRVSALQRNDALLREAFPQVESVPTALLARLGLNEVESRPAAEVVDLASERAKRAAQTKPRWTAAKWKVAAQLVLVVGIGGLVGSQWVRAPAPAEHKLYQTLGNGKVLQPASALILFRHDVQDVEARRMLQAVGAKIVDERTVNNAYRVDIPAEKRAAALAMLRKKPQVEMAEPINGGDR